MTGCSLARLSGGYAARLALCFAAAFAAGWTAGPARAAAKFSLLYSPLLQDGPIMGDMSLAGNGLVGTVKYDGCCGAVFYYNVALHQFATGHAFSNFSEGEEPNTLLVDSGNTIWGTTGAGGTNGFGTLFSISPAGNFQKLYDFGNGTDGAWPLGQLTEDSNGRLYGVTTAAGPGNGGTIFRFDPTTNGLTTMYHFSGGTDGRQPLGGLVWDAQGNLLGVTMSGGKLSACLQGCGTVFRFNPATSRFRTLHVFSVGRDGAVPLAGLTAGPNGIFYGTTSQLGGRNGGIFAIDAQSGAFTSLYGFSALFKTGHVASSLTLGADGALYGAAPWGGLRGGGEIFRFDPATRAYHTLYAFDRETNGVGPVAKLTIGPEGAVYGATATYGSNDEGTLFQLTVVSLAGHRAR